MNEINKEIKSLINNFLDILNLQGDINVSLSEDDNGKKYILVEISGEKLSELIGYHGKSLNSFQHIINLGFNRNREDRMRIILDINGYRKKREDYLRSVAQRAIVNVKETRQSMSLTPMNPADRRIVHLEVKKDEDVGSESEGSDPNRYIVIKPN
ncbi:KH domain-containing protein [Candidatus Dojkabacteria bacterium]|nr:KH domain-containing protein [Candidatus Dojkabacteria bacterium]